MLNRNIQYQRENETSMTLSEKMHLSEISSI